MALCYFNIYCWLVPLNSHYLAFLLSPHRVCQVSQDFQDHQETKVRRVMRVCPDNQDCKASKEKMEASGTQVGFPSVTFILFVYKQSFRYYNHTSCGFHGGVCTCVCCTGQQGRPGDKGTPGLPGSAGEPGRGGRPGTYLISSSDNCSKFSKDLSHVLNRLLADIKYKIIPVMFSLVCFI